MDGLEYRVHRVLSLMQWDFPACIHVITLHFLHHLLMFIRRCPLYGFWMYPMEHLNNWIKSRVQNRYPESTVVETYQLYFTFKSPSNFHLVSILTLQSAQIVTAHLMAVQSEYIHRQGRHSILDSNLVDLNHFVHAQLSWVQKRSRAIQERRHNHGHTSYARDPVALNLVMSLSIRCILSRIAMTGL